MERVRSDKQKRPWAGRYGKKQADALDTTTVGIETVLPLMWNISPNEFNRQRCKACMQRSGEMVQGRRPL